MNKRSSSTVRRICIKIIVSGILTVAVIVPVLLILARIEDRKSARETTVRETGIIWGCEQTVDIVFLSSLNTFQIMGEDGYTVEESATYTYS